MSKLAINKEANIFTDFEKHSKKRKKSSCRFLMLIRKPKSNLKQQRKLSKTKIS